VLKSKLFFFFYFTVAALLYAASLPILILLSFKNKYTRSIPSRFFLYRNKKLPLNCTWFHACSLGEVSSLKPLLAHFDDAAITTTTQTGYAQAKSLVRNCRYLPFEIFLPFWVTKQRVLVVLEAELWYLLFASAKMKGMKTILLSARVSDKSYKSYMRFRWLYAKIFENIDIVYAQSQKDKLRLLELGAKKVEVAGNIKLANLPKVTTAYEKPDRLLITAASTHEGEEELVLRAFITANLAGATLVIVPRHPERFEKAAQIVQKMRGDLTFHRFSERKDFASDIVLVDMMGELNNVYALTDVTILCGAFEKIGGHNPIEPAFFHNKIISGEHYFNQHATYKYVQNIEITKDLTASLRNHEKLQQATIDSQEFDLNRVIQGIKDASI